MDAEEKFVEISGLICEPKRAKILWNLLDGKAYTSSELALVADISATSASNHLSKLLDADILKVESQGRHRYYSFSRSEVAYAVESLANLIDKPNRASQKEKTPPANGIKFCRSCYDHLAGYIGVQITESLEKTGYIKTLGSEYHITENGWQWVIKNGILSKEDLHKRRPLTRKCLDWSERKSHIAGQFGAAMLSKMLEKNWFKRVQFSRELIITSKGRQELRNMLDLDL